MAGKFPFMIFGLPERLWQCIEPLNPKKKGGGRSAFICGSYKGMITGITEPLEFTFLFVAPILYIIHCIFAGLSFMLMHIFHVGVGMTFSGGLIDLFLFGILQEMRKQTGYG